MANIIFELGLDKEKLEVVRASFSTRYGRQSMSGVIRLLVNNEYEKIVTQTN